MNLLAIETATSVCSVAVMQEDKISAEIFSDNGNNHSVALMPMIDSALSLAGIRSGELTHIAVSSGPGSFTGLRIGASTAKGMSVSLGIPLITASTLEALCYNLPVSTEATICSCIDARSNRVYYGMYRFKKGGSELETIVSPSVDLVENLPIKSTTLFIGSGVVRLKSVIEGKFGNIGKIPPYHLCNQRASSLAFLSCSMGSNSSVPTLEYVNGVI